ncbi:uncharacterized protein PHALS_12675 [Plasmopara halstedii]|uniref:Uncharacterized protein n=1 Tax=Plasmopara halstedii TaxID=4781 RepID=A0A0N7L5T8_PLAHL|nr:uncharacterized protein PHALS_12675 [Plasmopara halstedii]CEG42395.1 hypothetical protein PHALS_12675 [Plasmopara halstedii]|eukprot:XP_024578764.1 hypothetical protein PHALS_12675 [Plasmopara halstedii]
MTGMFFLLFWLDSSFFVCLNLFALSNRAVIFLEIVRTNNYLALKYCSIFVPEGQLELADVRHLTSVYLRYLGVFAYRNGLFAKMRSST